jgi:hypothetical protein
MGIRYAASGTLILQKKIIQFTLKFSEEKARSAFAFIAVVFSKANCTFVS